MKESNIEEERLSTEVTDEDLGRGAEDEYGVIYSPDGKRLLGCRDRKSLEEYTVKEGTKVICDEAFSYCRGYYRGSSYYRGLGSIIFPEGLISIGDRAFEECDHLGHIILPNSLTSIGDSAFEDCENLYFDIFPEGLASIGNRAFYGCDRLDSFVFPESLVSIGIWAFNGCHNLTSLSLPESLISIGEGAFGDSDKLSSVTIPKNVREIGARPFSRFTQIICDSPHFKLENDLLIQGTTVISMTGGSKFITIPQYVTAIGKSAFNGCDNLVSVTLPQGLTSIGDYTFSGCAKLSSIILPDGLTSIGDEAFWGCDRLTSLRLPESLCSLGTVPFSKATQITSKSPHVKVENGLLIFDTTVISMIGKDKRVVVPSYVTSIGRGALEGCEKMVSISLPDTLTAMEKLELWGCKKLRKILVRCSPNIDEGFAVRKIQNLLDDDLKDKVKVDKSR